MQIDYDAKTNAAYILLVPVPEKDVRRTHSVAGEGVMLDFSPQGTLCGVEVLNARERLPASLLGEAALGYVEAEPTQQPVEPWLTAEQRAGALVAMKAASTAFYHAAQRIGIHPFIEFTGLMNEYIQICERAHVNGIDFSLCNIHLGNDLPMRGYEVKYINEKLECIFTGQSVMKSERVA